MKKLLVVLVMSFSIISANTFESKAIGVIIKVGKGISTFHDCYPGNGICFVVILTRTTANTALANSSAEKDVEYIDGTAELKDGKLQVTTSKPISEGARNERGAFEFAIKEQGVKSSVTIDPSVTNELGVESLTVAPGNYEFKNSTVTLRTVRPRDISTGQSSGKRSNIVIDESGVHKEAKPKGTASSESKPTYDLKVNK